MRGNERESVSLGELVRVQVRMSKEGESVHVDTLQSWPSRSIHVHFCSWWLSGRRHARVKLDQPYENRLAVARGQILLVVTFPNFVLFCDVTCTEISQNCVSAGSCKIVQW